ncbi:hypothetical protein PoB_003938500 [Plakobranchus ocellatus]|uniref:Uncharacterized protein n=1 Tax=Plakobranchus ocellatus TaxID=259542 RepID=A0AAV4AWY7_9GAST|nr:hypothetical protein PoB_003938500 [Plakobranchus ocellatus]
MIHSLMGAKVDLVINLNPVAVMLKLKFTKRGPCPALKERGFLIEANLVLRPILARQQRLCPFRLLPLHRAGRGPPQGVDDLLKHNTFEQEGLAHAQHQAEAKRGANDAEGEDSGHPVDRQEPHIYITVSPHFPTWLLIALIATIESDQPVRRAPDDLTFEGSSHPYSLSHSLARCPDARGSASSVQFTRVFCS